MARSRRFIAPLVALVLTNASLLAGFRSEAMPALNRTATSASPSPTPSRPSVPASFTFQGAGFGHGIGLSQYGAQGMAKDGFSAKEIVTHYYPSTSLKTMKMPTNLVVGLLQDRSSTSRKYVALRSEGIGGTGNALSIKIGSSQLTIPANKAITLGLLNNQIVVYGSNGIYQDANKKNLSASSISVSWGKQTQGTKVATVVNVTSSTTAANAVSNLGATCVTNACNHRYKYGTLTITPYSNGTLNVSNTLALDNEYLYGLGEVPSLWEPAALQAQVIAARSYAYSKYVANKNLQSKCACQIYGTPADQNFVGFNKEVSTAGDKWVAAVDATSGQVVTSGGRVIQAFFSSSTGGYSQPVGEVWGSSGYPWLTKVDDHWSLLPSNPNASWSVTFTQSQIVNKLKSAGINVKDVAMMAITGHYASGGVSEITIADSAGRVTSISCIPTLLKPPAPNISPEGLRSIFNLKSTYVKSVSASKNVVPGSSNNPPDVLTMLNVKNWPVTNQFPPANFVIQGMVSPAQYGVKVTLLDQLNKKWSTMATTQTDFSGFFKLNWQGVPAGNHQLRIVAENQIGSVRIDSPQISVQGKITLTGPGTAHPKRTVHLTGTLRPVIAAINVVLQRKINKAKWQTLGKTYTDVAGDFSFDTKIGTRKANYLYRVIAKDPQLGVTVSVPLRVIVK